MKMLLGLLVVAGLIYGGKMYLKPTSQPTASPVVVEDVKIIKMEGVNFRFTPSEIKVKLGDKVRVVLTAVDMPHDFNLDELGVNGEVAQPGETVEVEFTADQVGRFEYYCSVGQHRANGMVGKLTVTE